MTAKKIHSGNQWLWDTEYPDWKEFLPVAVPREGFEYSKETVSHSGRQYPLWSDPNLSRMFHHKQYDGLEPVPEWDEAAGNIYLWTQKFLNDNGFDYQIRPIISWFIDYDVGGWQSMHQHDPNCITQILYLDSTPHLQEEHEGKDTVPGSMYAVVAGGGKEPVYRSFYSWPGRCIIMKGDVWHGVYPVRSTPRRSIVIDYMKVL
jgi:hypothetical protein